MQPIADKVGFDGLKQLCGLITIRHRLLRRAKRIAGILQDIIQDCDDAELSKFDQVYRSFFGDALTFYVDLKSELEFIKQSDGSSAQLHGLNSHELENWKQHLAAVNATLIRVTTLLSRRYKAHQNVASAAKFAKQRSSNEAARRKQLNHTILMSDIILGNAETSAGPIYLNLDPTNICNFRCRTCFQSVTQNFEQGVISKRVIQTIYPAIETARQVRLFGGGEPTLSPFLAEICAIVSNTHTWTEILTNGSTLGKRELPLEQLSSIGISIDGATARTFETLRKGTQFDNLLERIRTFRNSSPDTHMYFNVTVNRANLDEIVAITQLAAEFKIQLINFTPMRAEYSHLEELDLRAEDIPVLRLQLEQARRIALLHGIAINSVINEEFLLKPQTKPRDKDQILTTLSAFETQAALSIPQVADLQKFFVVGSFELYPPAASMLAGHIALRNAAQVRAALTSPNQLPDDLCTLERLAADKVAQVQAISEESILLPYCMSPWVHLFVLATGALRGCCVLAEPQEMGDLTGDAPFVTAWNSPELVQLRKSTLNKAERFSQCEECNFEARYLILGELLEFLRGLNKDVSKLQFPHRFYPPPVMQAQLQLTQ